MTERTLTSIL
jgi:hypothetical protein